MPAIERMLFLHTPKTAGLTLRKLLRQRYPGRRSLVVRLEQPREKGRDRYLDYLRGDATAIPPPRVANEPFKRTLLARSPEDLEVAQVVMGHFWFGLHEVLPGSWRYITILRDPVDRVLSMYQHREDRHNLGLSVEGYIRSERDFHMDNEQVRRLANDDRGDIRRGPCTPEMFERAVRNLEEHVAVAGLTERFDEMLVVLGHLQGWKRSPYVIHNVTARRPRAEELDPETLRILQRHTEYDRELHRIATERFDALVASTGLDVAAMAADLRRRSARYSSSWWVQSGLARRFATAGRKLTRFRRRTSMRLGMGGGRS